MLALALPSVAAAEPIAPGETLATTTAAVRGVVNEAVGATSVSTAPLPVVPTVEQTVQRTLEGVTGSKADPPAQERSTAPPRSDAPVTQPPAPGAPGTPSTAVVSPAKAPVPASDTSGEGSRYWQHAPAPGGGGVAASTHRHVPRRGQESTTSSATQGTHATGSRRQAARAHELVLESSTPGASQTTTTSGDAGASMAARLASALVPLVSPPAGGGTGLLAWLLMLTLGAVLIALMCADAVGLGPRHDYLRHRRGEAR